VPTVEAEAIGRGRGSGIRGQGGSADGSAVNEAATHVGREAARRVEAYLLEVSAFNGLAAVDIDRQP
jgi:hypothetical protein